MRPSTLPCDPVGEGVVRECPEDLQEVPLGADTERAASSSILGGNNVWFNPRRNNARLFQIKMFTIVAHSGPVDARFRERLPELSTNRHQPARYLPRG